MNGDIGDDLPPDGETRTFETEYDDRPPSIAIVEAIASIEGVRSTDVDFSLYDSVDSDALDTLFADGDDGGVVAVFHVSDYVVTVRDDGTITVEAPEESE